MSLSFEKTFYAIHSFSIYMLSISFISLMFCCSTEPKQLIYSKLLSNYDYCFIKSALWLVFVISSEPSNNLIYFLERSRRQPNSPPTSYFTSNKLSRFLLQEYKFLLQKSPIFFMCSLYNWNYLHSFIRNYFQFYTEFASAFLIFLSIRIIFFYIRALILNFIFMINLKPMINRTFFTI